MLHPHSTHEKDTLALPPLRGVDKPGPDAGEHYDQEEISRLAGERKKRWSSPKGLVCQPGEKYGRLTVLREGPGIRSPKQRIRRVVCRCDCGNEVFVQPGHLRSGRQVSCSCVHREKMKARLKHGNTKEGKISKEYHTYQAMLNRCYCPTSNSFEHYGGRGIKVCAAWRDDFATFLADIGKAPGPEFSLDRIDVDGDYEPKNCRWASVLEQANNKRSNKRITFRGATMTVSQWARQLGLRPGTLVARLGKLGWPVDKALLTPLTKRS